MRRSKKRSLSNIAGEIRKAEILKLRVALFLMKFATVGCGFYAFWISACFGWNENPYPFSILIFAEVGAVACACGAASGIPTATLYLERLAEERDGA